MIETVRLLGFGSFAYGLSTERTLTHDSRYYHWTTLPSAWTLEYDQRSYVEVDPRVAHGWANPTPLIWDHRFAHGRTEVAAFLNAAAAYGVGSGVTVFFRDDRYCRVLVALDSPRQELGERDVTAWADQLPGILMLAFEFHSVFRRRFVAQGVPPQQQGAPLSPREQQCLLLAAKGQTSADIALKLALSERTINFHFCNIVSKLAVANRAEAIGLAVSRGIIKL
jgi:DNA-binding CsgD family transcriptional regulator